MRNQGLPVGVVTSHRSVSIGCPDTPIGRATRLKPECLQVRLLLWALKNKAWLGRQLADHFGLEPEMLWVRIPLELLRTPCGCSVQRPARLASNQLVSVRIRVPVLCHLKRPRGAAECSLACHARGRRFKSDRGRFQFKRRGTQTGKAAELKPP